MICIYQTIFVLLVSASLIAGNKLAGNDPNCPAGQIPITQTFPMAGRPVLAVSDENFLYITYYADTHVFAYLRGTDGFLLGTGYSNSYNKSLEVFGTLFCSIGQYQDQLLIGVVKGLGIRPNWVATINKNTFRVATEYFTQADGGMAADSYGYMYLNTGVNFVVYNFTGTQSNNTKSYYVNYMNLTGLGFTISSDDKFYLSQESNINIFTIVRDDNNIPLKFEYLSSIKTSKVDMFSNLSFSKAGNLVGLRNQGPYTNLVSVFDKNGVETTYCTPINTTLTNGCNDMKFGYTFLLGNPTTLYVVADIF